MIAALKGHPRGAYLLVFTELLERFSFYGMRGLLVLFMTRTIAESGLAWEAAPAIGFFGLFSSLIWFSPIFGGWAADRWLGQRRAVFIGGLLMAFGHFALVAASFVPDAFAGVTGKGLLALGSLARSAPLEALLASGQGRSLMVPAIVAQASLIGGLLLIVLGNGLLKPCITVMLGELYSRDDPRRDAIYTLFYVGISAGALLAALSAGTIGEKIGWRYGFLICGAVMFGGILFYARQASRWLGEIGLPGYRPELGEAHESRGKGARGSAQLSAARAVAYIAILSLFAVVFWTGYEQSGGLLNLYIFEKVDRTVLGFAVPATWLLTLPAFFCILVGVAVAEALLRIEKHGVVLDPPRRFAGGLIVGALAFAVFAWAANSTDSALPVGLSE